MRIGPGHRTGSAARLADEHLAMQRPLDQVGRLGGSGQPPALVAVRGQYRLDRARRQMRAELGPSRPVAIPGAVDAGPEVMPGQRCQRDRVALEHAVQQVIGRDDIEQPGDG